MADDALILALSEIDPPVAYAGEREQWTVRLAGLDLPAGGRVKLQLSGGRGNDADWEPPQVENPAGDAYVSARASNGVTLSLGVTTWDPDRESAVEITVAGLGLPPDEVLTVVLGDRSGGGGGIQPQTFSQRCKPLFVLVDRGNGQWIKAANPPVLEVRGGPPDTIRLIVPSTLRADEHFDGLIRIEDTYGNLANYYEGHLQLAREGGRLKLPSPVTLSEADGCLYQVRDLHLREPADGFRLRVREPNQGKRVRSNPVCVLDDDYPYNLYWGVLHGHTNHSDGIGTPEEYFAYARDVSRLDFGALGDHDHTWETSDEMWRHSQEVTARFNEPNRFVTLLGYEWAKWRRNGDGDRCVYYLDDNQPMYRSDDGHYPRPWNLFAALHEAHQGRALVIPHHTANKGNFCDFSRHDPLHERLIEIYSVWGSSECSVHDGNPFPTRPPNLPEGGEVPNVPLDAGEEPVGFVQRALSLGWRVGFTAGGDDHHGHPGDPVRTGPEPFRYRDGLLGLWASDLTREAIWEALWHRRTVATTGARIILGWALSGYFMGSEVPVDPGDALVMQREIVVDAYAEERILAIEILRNNEVVHRTRTTSDQAVVHWADEDPLDLIALRPDASRAAFVFYYVRLLQADGEMAWASPIWLELRE